jgi:hypothetical protein
MMRTDFGIRRRHVGRLGRAYERVRAQPGVVFGTKEQCHRMLPPIVDGRDRSCFCRDRAQYRPQHHPAQDPRGAQGRQICRQRPEGLDFHAQVANKILLLARTTPLEEVKTPTAGLETVLYRLRQEAGHRA